MKEQSSNLEVSCILLVVWRGKCFWFHIQSKTGLNVWSVNISCGHVCLRDVKLAAGFTDETVFMGLHLKYMQKQIN